MRAVSSSPAFAGVKRLKTLSVIRARRYWWKAGEPYAQLKSVMAYANAEIIYDIDDVARMMKMISINKKMSDSISQLMNEQVRASLSKRTVVRFTPFHYVSWDHGKLGGFY
jgi:hypothetical protein